MTESVPAPGLAPMSLRSCRWPRPALGAALVCLLMAGIPISASAETTEVPLDHIGPRWLGTQWHDNLGWHCKSPGDLNGDGYADFAVSAPQDEGPMTFESNVLIYFGRPDLPYGRTDAGWYDTRISDGKIGGDSVFEFSFVDDATGDGLPDLLVVEPKAAEAGKVLLHAGSGSEWPEQLSANNAVARWDGYLQQELGTIPAETRPSQATGGDFDGDGLSDIVMVSALFQRAWIQYSTAGYSGTTSLAELTDVLSRCSDEIPAAEFGEDLRIGDFNGDGNDDLVISAPGCNDGEGRVFAWYGGTGPLDTNPDLEIPGGELLGGAIEVADLNSDGHDDLFVQERLSPDPDDPNREDRGNLWVFFGSAAGLAEVPDFKLLGGFSDRRFGSTVAVLNDISSPPDGLADLVVGAPQAAYSGIGQGAIYVFEGRSDWPDEVDTSEAVFRVVGSHRDSWFGASIATVSDFDGNGYDELLIGEPNYTEGDTENDYHRGRIYLFTALPDRDEDADGVSTMAGDCDDTDAAIRPTALEICDGIDNNCDHRIDEGCEEGDDDDSSAAGDDDGPEPAAPEGCQCSAGTAHRGAGLLLAVWLLAAVCVRRYPGRRTE